MKFALISNPRTGSSTLCNYFRDIGVFILHEPFRPVKGPFPAPGLLLRDVDDLWGADGIKHVTTHVNYIVNQGIIDWLLGHDVKIVGLRRKSIIWTAISLAIAKQTNTWEVRRIDPQQGVQYDSQAFKAIPVGTIYQNIDILTEYEGLFKKYNKKILLVHYEDLFSGDLNLTRHWIDMLLNVLKLPTPSYYKKLIPEHFSINLKQNRWATYHKIPNWKQIKREFKINEG